MTRSEQVLEILAKEIDGHFDLVVRCEPEWLRTHPGGFAPLPLVAEGEIFHICPERIAQVSTNLDQSEFESFCHAIATWQNATVLTFTLRLSPDLIVAEFTDRFPGHAEMLLRVATEQGIPLEDFLGATTREK